MDYSTYLDNEIPRIKHDTSSKYTVLDLFAGCGGLALGLESVGFKTTGYEMLSDACETYSSNLQGLCHEVFLEPGQHLAEEVDVIVGGPPCQPFSVGGLQGGKKDSRDGFGAFLSAVETCKPQLVMFENVRGMLYRNKEYFYQVVSKLQKMDYLVDWKILKAVQFNVPQKRERLFVVAHRGNWKFPGKITGSPITAGDALGALALQTNSDTKFLTKSMDQYIARYEKKSQCVRPRDLHLDEPSRTITCRNIAGATADMMRIKLPSGKRKRISVREAARLQSFPDWFEFHGSETSQFNQIGNAVPPILGKALGVSILSYLESKDRFTVDYIRTQNSFGQMEFVLNN